MNQKILGDKKQRRYDEGLIDLVNKKYAKEIITPETEIITPAIVSYDKDCLVVIERYAPAFFDVSGKEVVGRDGSLDAYCAGQLSWFQNWNRLEDMISMPDVYKLAKQLRSKDKNLVYIGTYTFELPSEEIRKKLLDDFFEKHLVTSTKIVHLKDRIFNIFHHNNSIKSQVEKREIFIPEYRQGLINGKFLHHLKGDDQTLKFFQALLDTEDNWNDIFSNLVYLFKDEDRTDNEYVTIYTAMDSGMQVGKKTACVLYRGGEGLYGIIGVNENLQLPGRTRGVKYVRS